MERIKNLTQYFQYDTKATNLVFHSGPGDEATLVEFDINPVGPCVVRAHAPDTEKGKPGESWLVGVYDERDTLRFALPFAAVRVSLEPSGEVWVRRPRTVSTEENPNPDENFTRMEKQGIDMDPVQIALQRQSILTRIQTNRESAERDSYTLSLERKLEELASSVATLQAEKAPPEIEQSAE